MLYLRRDVNGGINISIPLTVIVAFITIMAAFIPAAMAYGELTNKVENLEEIRNIEMENYRITILTVESRLDKLDNIAAGTEVSLQNIEDDLSEIKTDLKDLIRTLKAYSEGGR